MTVLEAAKISIFGPHVNLGGSGVIKASEMLTIPKAMLSKWVSLDFLSKEYPNRVKFLDELVTLHGPLKLVFNENIHLWKIGFAVIALATAIFTFAIADASYREGRAPGAKDESLSNSERVRSVALGALAACLTYATLYQLGLPERGNVYFS